MAALTGPRALLGTVRAKIALWFTVVIGAVSAFIFVYFPARLEEQQTEALGRKAQSIAAMAAYSARSGVVFEDREAVAEALLGALENPDLVYIAVVDTTGHVLAFPSTRVALGLGLRLANEIPSVPDTYEHSVPIEFRGRRIGHVRLALSRAEMRREIAAARRITAVVSVLVFLGALGAVLMISAYVTGPLRRMVGTAGRIAEGDLSERAPVASGDEVGHLAAAFNTMVGRLAQATTELQVANRRLAAEVEHRTSAWIAESTGRKLAEAQRTELEQFHADVLDGLPAQVGVLDSRGRFLYLNPAAVEDAELRQWAVGKTPNECMRAAQLANVDCRPPWRHVVAACFGRRETVTFEQAIRDRAGTVRHYIRTLGPLTASVGGESRFIGYGLEVTALKEAEAALRQSEDQFRQAQRLEAIGRLAAGLAHDFNNLLTVISGHASLLLLDLEEGSELREDAAAVVSAVQSATNVTRQLLAFSRKQVLKPEKIDLNEVVGRVGKMLLHLLGEDIAVVQALKPGLGVVHADPGQIEQVILNLAVNAQDAMPNGGRLTISTGNVLLDDEFVRTHAGAQAGPHVLLSVSDTGTGMSEDVQARIFEPFFTTKEQGKGTGLGLATVYGIVKQSGGCIYCESVLGRGTTFRLYFSRVEPVEPAAAPATLAAEEELAGTETILLVEDADAVRGIARRVLEGAGYTVLEASAGGEAIAMSRAYREPIHLLLTDVVMPGMNGRQVAESVRSERGETKVLFMSGYTDDVTVHHGMLSAGVRLLEKPFTAAGLLERVRGVLDGR
ncbi:MAG: ATP-binding protein [Candidatus Latescibacterota bacterium]